MSMMEIFRQLTLGEWPGPHGGRVARRGIPAAPEGYRPRARAVHLRLSWAGIPQQRAAALETLWSS
jgi:hypothetical protein